jgi:threonylcarbamoyladenosine tRNA methylthiotransferase MtaB
MSERRRFFVQNFGCRATQADGAAIAADLSKRGLERGDDWNRADVVVVNTCTVTAEADSDARQTIRRIHRENPSAEILVTGCYAQRRPDDLAALPGVRWVVGNSHKPQIGTLLAPERSRLVSITPAAEPFHGGVPAGQLLVGEISAQRQLLTAPMLEPGRDRSRPNLKVQDGCNNRCTFCIIPSVRGLSRSAPADFVIEETRKLAATYPEIVLTGINLGRWGRDLPGRPRFHVLLQRLLAETDIRKIRISSVEPMDWTQDVLELAAGEPRICKHMHIPLQSASDSVLRRMRRRYRIRHYADRIVRARRLMPTASIGADVMVGFPGETDVEFEETRAFIEQSPLTYLHVFSYSAREGTPAAEARGQVPKAVKKERNRILRDLIAAKHEAFRRELNGTVVDAVTLERVAADGTAALTDNFLDLVVPGPRLRPAKLVRLRLTANGADVQ